LSSCPVMDDPPSARANNTELIRDVLAIIFHGDACHARALAFCTIRRSQNPSFYPIFFATGCPRLASARRCESVIGRARGDRPIKMQNTPALSDRHEENQIRRRGELRNSKADRGCVIARPRNEEAWDWDLKSVVHVRKIT